MRYTYVLLSVAVAAAVLLFAISPGTGQQKTGEKEFDKKLKERLQKKFELFKKKYGQLKKKPQKRFVEYSITNIRIKGSENTDYVPIPGTENVLDDDGLVDILVDVVEETGYATEGVSLYVDSWEDDAKLQPLATAEWAYPGTYVSTSGSTKTYKWTDVWIHVDWPDPPTNNWITVWSTHTKDDTFTLIRRRPKLTETIGFVGEWWW